MADSTVTDLRPPTSTRISLDTIRQATKSLINWKTTKSTTETPQLLGDDDYFYINVTLKKIPSKARLNPYKIALPHPLHLASETELCLIIDDRKKAILKKADVKKKIEDDEIGVGKVLKLSKLRTDYVAFEAKRKLCDSYDMFLVDKRLVLLLPKLIGRQFYKKKKMPIAIDLSRKNWKEQIGKAIGSGLLYLRTGTCCVMKVARAGMDVEEIVENVMAAVNGIVEIVPKKWDGLRSLHLKLIDSLSLPIYQALPDLKLKINGVESVEEEVVDVNEVSDGDKIDESVMKKKSKKGEIREVIDMDKNNNDLADGGELGSDDENGNVESEDDAAVVVESPIKKRKKAADKLEKAAGETKLKKAVISRKKDDAHLKKKVSSDDSSEKKLKKVAKSAKKENVEGAKIKVPAKNNETKKLKTEVSNLKDKKRSRVAK